MMAWHIEFSQRYRRVNINEGGRWFTFFRSFGEDPNGPMTYISVRVPFTRRWLRYASSPTARWWIPLARRQQRKVAS